MKRIFCSLSTVLLVAALPFGSVLAQSPKEKAAKVTLVYQHELPNVPGKSIKGVLVEYGPGGYSPALNRAEGYINKRLAACGEAPDLAPKIASKRSK